MDAALRELTRPYERDSPAWSRGPAGKWTAGQHVEHVGRVLAIGADALEHATEELLRGDLGRRPWRDPLQALVVYVMTTRFPSGGKAPRASVPSAAPDREAALASIAKGAVRHRVVAEKLTPEQGERLWIWNPYARRLRWHYTFAEVLKVQAGHARHHARSAAEPAVASGAARRGG